MRQATQGLALAFIGAVLVRLALTGEYLRFVTPWMRWPLLVTGVVLLGLAVRPLLGGAGRHDEDRVPWATWLLLVPGVVVFVVTPPALGSYLAERRATDEALPPPVSVYPDLPDTGEPVELPVSEFMWRAQVDDGRTLVGREVRLTGFVSEGRDGWYVTRLSISCCAADALVTRVAVADADAPPKDQWVEVTGTWVEGTGTSPDEPAVISASDVVDVERPAQPYD